MSDQLFTNAEIGAQEEQSTAKRIRRTKKEVEEARREEAIRLLCGGSAPAEEVDSAVHQAMNADEKKLWGKLMLIQRNCQGFIKDSTSVGDDGKEFKYVCGTRVLGHIRPMMDKYGLMLVPSVASMLTPQIIDTTEYDKAGNSYPAKKALYVLNMTFTWVDSETGAKIQVPFNAAGCNGLDQGIGSAMTYAERYFLLKFFHIPTDDDDLDALSRVMESLRHMPEGDNAPALAAQVAPIQEAPEAPAEEKPKRTRKSSKKAAEEQPKEETPEAPAEGETKAAESAPEAGQATVQEQAKADAEAEQILDSLKDTGATEQTAPAQAEAEKPAESTEKAGEDVVRDDNGQELAVSPVDEKPAEKVELLPQNEFWFKVIMRYYGEVDRMSKDQIREDLKKDYIFTNEVFEQFYGEITQA